MSIDDLLGGLLGGPGSGETPDQEAGGAGGAGRIGARVAAFERVVGDGVSDDRGPVAHGEPGAGGRGRFRAGPGCAAERAEADGGCGRLVLLSRADKSRPESAFKRVYRGAQAARIDAVQMEAETSMNRWQTHFRVDPLPRLLASSNPPIAYFARRDLLDEAVERVEVLWELPAARRILCKQRTDGSWKYPGQQKAPHQNYALVETFRNLGFLVEQFGLDRRHPAIVGAAGYVFSCQTAEGDFRGIYSQQYATTYSPALMELLIKAGYADDSRIEHGFRWLLSIRQSDGGWTIPFLTTGMRWDEGMRAPSPIPPDPSKPFSHLATGTRHRAFAAHPRWRRSQDAIQAGALLESRFFKRDRYSGRDAASFWERVSFPFWFTDIVSALDSLTLLGFTAREPAIAAALDWLRERQREDGSFAVGLLRAGADKDTQSWVDLAICRAFKRCLSYLGVQW